MSDIAKLLDTLIAKAPGLREAGVREVQFDGVSVKLAPHEPVVERGDDEEPETYSDPMEDPALYPGGKVPGWTLRTKQ